MGYTPYSNLGRGIALNYVRLTESTKLLLDPKPTAEYAKFLSLALCHFPSNPYLCRPVMDSNIRMGPKSVSADFPTVNAGIHWLNPIYQLKII